MSFPKVPPSGIWAPAITFFDPETDTLLPTEQGTYYSYLSKSGLAGLVILGTNAETFLLTREERTELIEKTVGAVVKEIEPLLANAGPFFGGSDKLTLAEVLTGSFVIRLWTWPKYGLVPQSLIDELSVKAPNFTRWAEAVATHPSVSGIFDEKGTALRTKQRLGL
ncbi:hypothetical protein ONZ43_g1711 [Nemania bipapillata]|uniref:Uncharacterized protein n=1 Tax=Nemania bipapillata TaxID=110536 RepID=A0ACC2J3A3_9PEZI|nr:hypothetical protein ONZ43_g1711 [Nemania bipapillata]